MSNEQDQAGNCGPAMLALRRGERLQYGDVPPDRPCRWYRVALIGIPTPGNMLPQCGAFAVACAELVGDEYGWVTVARGTKDLIGGHLIERGAMPGQWYYLVLLQPEDTPVGPLTSPLPPRSEG